MPLIEEVCALARYVLGRVIQFLIVIWSSTSLVFFTVTIAVDPIRTMLPPGAPEETVAQLRAAYGFDDPVLTQYLRFLGNLARGQFGESLWLHAPSLEAVLQRLPATAWIVLPSALIGVTLGLLVGATAARRPGGIFDNVANVVSYGFLSMAEFWVAIALILVFAVQLGVLPTGGTAAGAMSLVLPVAVLALRPFAHVTQVVRSGMISEWNKQYVTTARAKGVSETTISRRHVLRNALPPVITISLYDLSRTFVGSAVAVEVVMAWPGIGRLAVGALERGDIFLIQAIVVVAAVVVAGLNLIADLLIFVVDPRARSIVRSVP